MAQSRSITLQKHQKKKLWGTYQHAPPPPPPPQKKKKKKMKENSTYDTADAQIKRCIRGTAFDRSAASRKHACIILTPLNPTFI